MQRTVALKYVNPKFFVKLQICSYKCTCSLVHMYIMFAKLIQSKSNISTKVVSQLIINQLFNITVKQSKLASDGHTMSQTDHQSISTKTKTWTNNWRQVLVIKHISIEIIVHKKSPHLWLIYATKLCYLWQVHASNQKLSNKHWLWNEYGTCNNQQVAHYIHLYREYI